VKQETPVPQLSPDRAALVDLLGNLGALAGGWRRIPLVIALDAGIVSFSLYVAFLVRFDSRFSAFDPGPLGLFWKYLPLLVAVRVGIHLLLGVHRWSFRFSGFYEAARLAAATFLGTGCLVAVFFLLHDPGLPRTVVVIETLLTLVLLLAFRFLPRLTHVWLLDTARSRAGAVPAIIIGAGGAGDLLLRDLHRSDEHRYQVVGFVDDDPMKQGISIGGRPVMGPIDALPRLVKRHDVRQLLVAIPRLPAARLRAILDSCAELKLNYKVLPLSFRYMNERVGVTMLQDLAPEDLLQRHERAFEPNELSSLIERRSILVTGAAGSIGSQICRQVVQHGPRRLVMTDINENGLYFLSRRLAAAYPEVEIQVEIADIRDRDRMAQLGDRYRPQDVFHAAAHKHVPLMEQAPEEAVKNNVSGCQNALLLAEAAEAERFVLISTDKAVHPTSVMGATKRICELLVRQHAIGSRTLHTTVRFGNVVGSDGSVVPLFKEQIARGGPVTVTHAECRRYLMTIPEAVGLVLLSGLGGYGDLCILEMGEPIRILDLARLMITMAGLEPEKDVPIVFTGLRPGEKLNEELMTEEEARVSQRMRGVIRVTGTPAPGAAWIRQVATLQELARRGDREGVLAALRTLVPGLASPLEESATVH
jgi:FlaA1/EpsC-like NDP-sugar epimerase